MADPALGVLIPLRIETLFDEPTAQRPRWQLRVLLVPDEPSLDRLDDRPSRAELDALTAVWASFPGPELELAAFRDVLSRLADRVGAPRAAWLLRRYVEGTGPFALRPELEADRAGAPQRPPRRSARLAGLPERVVLYALWRGESVPRAVGLTRIDRALLERDPLERPPEAWWTSWGRAKQSGLGAAFELERAPDELEALLAVGIGGGDPGELFARHREAGSLAVLGTGAPTNTVAGAPAAPLGHDAEDWLAALARGPQYAETDVSVALAGDLRLAPVPGGSIDHAEPGRLLVQALWPALLWHALKDVWGLPWQELHDAGVWAGRRVHPEGPLPPIRLRDQPYGLLPATALGRWRAAPGDEPIEAMLVAWLGRVRAALADAARTRSGTARGADTERLLALLERAPVTEELGYRTLIPLELAVRLLALQSVSPPPDLADRWDAVADAVIGLAGRRPERRYLAATAPQPLGIPLVEPTAGRLRDALEAIPTAGEALGPNGDTLLVRLLTLSRRLAYAEAARAAAQPPVLAPLLDDVALLEDDRSELYAWASRWTRETQEPTRSELHRAVDEAIELLTEMQGPGSDESTDRLARAFRAVLDCASHRVDPWLVGLAWRRYAELRPGSRAELGVYGWVDDPYTGPRDTRIRGVVHAPSDAQARAAVVLRDKALFDPEADRWKLSLDSRAVRTANRLAEEVRGGAHLSEALGREVERAVAAPDAVRWLRRRFPLREEHAGRRTCDGRKVLQAAPAELAGARLSAGAREALDELRAAVDAYGDLLVADAVYDVVQGRADTAGATMDAAAGLALPPELDVIRTPRRGRSALTTVLFALTPASPRRATAAELAEPAFAAFLRAQTGAPDAPAWTWRLGDRAVTLADLGLEPIHVLALTDDDVARLLRRARGGRAAARLRPGGPATLKRARRIAAQLACEPATAGLLAPDGANGDDPAVAELRTRVDELRSQARDLVVRLGTGPPAARRALAAAARWGIVPADDAADPAADAAAALEQRLDRGTGAEATPLDFARRLRELACPGAPLPILARIPRTKIDRAAGGTRPPLEPRTGRNAGRLGRDWLPVVAAVRPALARLEAFQLEAGLGAGRPLRPAASSLDDPWGRRHAEQAPRDRPHRLLVAYAADERESPLDGSQVAVGVVDSFGETIPDEEHVTAGAFHFDAPSARPPQAILLAVTPDVEAPLDEDVLAEIVAETRELAHARMATREDLAAFAAAVPLTTFPTAAPTGVRLDA